MISSQRPTFYLLPYRRAISFLIIAYYDFHSHKKLPPVGTSSSACIVKFLGL